MTLPDQSTCPVQGCLESATVRLLHNDLGTRRFCFRCAAEVNRVDRWWRDAYGDLFRAREHERDLLMLREFAR